jgi:hypothetical protein
MIRVKYSMNGSDFPLIWQTPGGKGKWGDCEFILDSSLTECDYWFVYENIKRTETTLCPRSNVFFITGEPPEIRRYNPFFLRQFARVITSQPIILHRHVVHSQTGLPWLVGIRYIRPERRWDSHHACSYDVLKSTNSVKKTKVMSVVTSDKITTKGHRKRLDFVRRLESRFGNEIDVFISGKVVLEDKRDAIEQYKYHIAIENSVCTDYWTEKLADSYLELAYPIYYGCPNLESYFPRTSFTRIDIDDFEGSAKTIESLLRNDIYKEKLDALRVAKDLILDKYNMFSLMAEQCKGVLGQRKELVTIKPELIPSTNELRKAMLCRMKTTAK